MSQHEPVRLNPSARDACHECPAAAASRRAFLHEAGLAALGALAVTAAVRPANALADLVAELKPARSTGARRTYALPSGDVIAVDGDNEVILARWENRIYAFSLRCPHRGARLEWREGEGRIFCPKHKARFLPSGAHASGRRARDLDRYDISREGASVVVDLDALRRADDEPEAWQAAVVLVS